MSWVVFDYGGVISQYPPAGELARLAAVAGCEVPEFTAAYWADRLSYDLGEVDATAFWQKAGGALGRSFTPAEVAELTRLDIQSWLHLRSGTVTLMQQLAAAGHRLALLSNAPAELAEAIRRLPAARLLEHLLFSCELRAAKPDPACYQAALARLGAQPGAVTFLDDRQPNVAAAAALGLRAVCFTTADQARAELVRWGMLPG